MDDFTGFMQGLDESFEYQCDQVFASHDHVSWNSNIAHTWSILVYSPSYLAKSITRCRTFEQQ